MLSTVDGDHFAIDDRAREDIAAYGARATDLLATLVDEAPTLHFEANHPEWWLWQGFGEWRATEIGGADIEVDQQGAALRRWSRLALDLAGRDLTGSVVVIDEPENALHPSAQIRLSAGLEGPFTDQLLGCVVATHSPALLGVKNAHLFHVIRDPVSGTRLESVDRLGDVDDLVEQLGVTRADVLSMTRSFVLVEGLHDETVIGTVFRDELRRRRARILRMSGAKQTNASLNTEMIARYSSARLVIVIDRIGDRASKLWEEAKAAHGRRDGRGVAERLDQLRRLGGGESKWVADALRGVIDSGQLDRVELVGLRRWDIIEYLPVRDLVPGAHSWDELRQLHRRSGLSVDFKDWLRKEHKARLSVSALANAARHVANPRDMDRILEKL